DGSGVLVVLTHGAVGLAGEDVADLAGAAVWGLVRSAQAEHPGRVVLVDSDGSVDITEVIGCGEPQLIVRSGVVHAARLASVGAGAVLELPAGSWRWRHVRGRGGGPDRAGGIGRRAGAGGGGCGGGEFPGCVGGVGDVSRWRRIRGRGRWGNRRVRVGGRRAGRWRCGAGVAG